MKLKYYLRGLGIGIVFCAIITFIAYGNDNKSISDEEIIKRAEKLGMVMKNDTNSQANENNKTTLEDITTEQIVKETTEKTTETVTEEVVSEEKTTEVVTTTEVTTSEEVTTEEKKQTTEEKKEDSTLVKATISVTAGMDSITVCQLLQDAGIVKDYLEFDEYLNQNGYSTQIRIKSCEFTNKMSFKEIAELLVKED